MTEKGYAEVIVEDNSVFTKQETIDAITLVCDELKDFLLEKNESYGNSALDPIRLFSKADPIEQINVRLDDKLSRILRGNDYGEDVEWDINGYLILKRVYMELRKGTKE